MTGIAALLFLPFFLVPLLLLLLIFISNHKKQKTLAQKEGLFFESKKGPIHYKVYGKKGPALLLIHGLGSSSYCWRHLVPDLSQSFKVVTVDLWGFGQSSFNDTKNMNLDNQTEILVHLMESLGFSNFHILGHSMGGHLGLWLSHQNPSKVGKVVAIAPPTHPKIVPLYIDKVTWIGNLTPWLINKKFVRKILKRILSDHSLITDEMVDAYYAPYQNPDSHLSFASSLKMLRDPRVNAALPSVHQEVLLLWGQKDQVVSQKIIELIHQKLPNSRLEISPRSNHMPIEDDIIWVKEMIFPFLKS